MSRKLTPRDLEEKRIAAEVIRGVQERELGARRLQAHEEEVRERAAKELARRELARRFMLPFVLRFELDYDAGWVHKDICHRLQKFETDVLEKRSPRLMLQLPPRHGKSVLASVNFPSWYLGRNPTHEFIACSYASSLAFDFSRKVRQRLRTPEYNLIFPRCVLMRDSQSTERWETEAGGAYMAAGVNGPITGKGAHVLTIDDPVKNAEDAESQSYREAAKDWYRSTAYTRLAPGGGVLIIQTRWNDDDLSGWLEQQMVKGLGDSFEIVRYPAVAIEDEPYRAKGEALHPARYDLEALSRIQRAVGPRVWSALYQQQPAPDEGLYFKADMIQTYEQLPNVAMRYYAAWDLAISKKERADYTVGVVVGISPDDDLYLVDVVRGRYDGFEIVEAILDTARKWKTEINGIEKGQIEMAIRPQLEKRIIERRQHNFYAEPLPAGQRDKEQRARAIQARMQQGKVFFPANASWMDAVRGELLRFPNGLHDDIVDALAWIGRMLTDLDGAKKSVHKASESWLDRLKSLGTSKRQRTFMAA